jgi:hypothetical protein
LAACNSEDEPDEPPIDWDSIVIDEPDPEPEPQPVFYTEEELYQMTKEDRSAENAVRQFFIALSGRRFDRAIEWLNLPRGSIFDDSDLENALLRSREEYPVGESLIDFEVSELRKNNEGTIIDVSFTRGTNRVRMQVLTVIRDADNRWLVDATPFVVTNWRIIVPRDCPMFINGELIPREAGVQDDRGMHTVYTISAIARREVEVRVESNVQEPFVRNVTPERNGEFRALPRLNDATFNEIREYLKKTLEDVIYSIENEPNPDVFTSYLDRNSPNAGTFVSMYNQAVQRTVDTVRYNGITVKDILPLSLDECRVESIDQVRMSVRVVYNRTETLASGRQINADTEARVWVILTRDGDRWNLWSADTNLLRFW